MGPNQNELNNVGSLGKADGAEKKSKFSLKSKKAKIILASLVAVIVVGGVGAAAYVNSIYNRPENVLASAMGKYLLDGKDKNFDATISLETVESDGQESILGSTDLKLNVQMSGKTTQVDIEANLAALKLSGAVQANENGNIYIQLKNLSELLGSAAADAYGIPEEMKQQIASLDEKWIEITKEDLASLTGGGSSTGELNKCTEALYSALDNKQLGDDFDKFYRKNSFLLANNPTEEEVDGKKLLRVEVGLDEAKLKSFGTEFSQLEDVKVLGRECGLGSEGNGAADTAEDAADGLLNGKMTAWLDRGKRELVKLEASGDSFDNDTKTGEVKFSMNVKEPAGKIEAPVEVVNIKELMEMFGIDPSVLNSAPSSL